jgi:putative ABC transport system permease protein
VSSYREAQPQLKQFLDQLARYLGLIGLTALFVGGIGVATTVQAFLREKLPGIAILKTLGAESRTIVGMYLLQAFVLAAIGSLAGVALGMGLQTVLPQALAGLLDTNLLEQVEFSSALSVASLPPILKGIGLGLLTTLLFTLWPIMGVRKIRPALVLRRAFLASEETPGEHGEGWRARIITNWRRLDHPKLVAAAFIVTGLAGLAMWQADSWRIGLLFLAGLLAGVAGLLLGASGLIRLLKRLPLPRTVSLRHAIGNLSRPGGQVAGIVMAIGIGVMVIVTVSVIERSLVRQIGEKRPADAPTFFFIDIQPDQAEGFGHLIHAGTRELTPQLTPLIRSRLHAVNGRPVIVEDESEKERETKDEQRKAWYFTREYVLTVLDTLPKDNAVTKGTWWATGQVFPNPLVSVEEEAAKHLGLDVGSTVAFEIQGATITAEVSSIRKVEWGNFSTNFYMILSPGSLEGAPFTYVATVRVPPQDEVALQQAVVARFPNVTAINIGEVLDSFARILDRLSLAIRAVALFCVAAASLVMAAALAATRYRRLYEAVVLKALGATRGVIARSFAVEYVLMGTVAGVIGIVLASSLSWAALRYVFDLPWSLESGLLLTGLFGTIALTLAIGFLSTYRILGQRPLAVLRQE